MKVLIRKKAVDDIDGLFAWIAKENPTVATEIVLRIRERIRRLGTPGLSHMGRLGAVTGTRELVEPPYIIVYHTHEKRDEVIILAVFHARQDR